MSVRVLGTIIVTFSLGFVLTWYTSCSGQLERLNEGTITGTPMTEFTFGSFDSQAGLASFTLCIEGVRFVGLSPSADQNIPIDLSDVTVLNQGNKFASVYLPAGSYTESQIELSKKCLSQQTLQVSNNNGTFVTEESIFLKFKGYAEIRRGGGVIRFDIQDLVEALEGVTSNELLATAAQSSEGLFGVANPVLPLDDFENGIRVVRPSESGPRERNLWTYYIMNGAVGLHNTGCYSGSSCVQSQVTSGDLQLFFHPTNGLIIQKMRDYLLQPASWRIDTYNRLRFWVKIPSNFQKAPIGQNNIEIAIRSNPSYDPTSNTNKMLSHFFNIPPTGLWHQVVIDTHPNFIAAQGGTGQTEFGDQSHPYGEENYNYFDGMTNMLFYFFNYYISSYPAAIQFDRFEVYSETRLENKEQVYSLNGVYNPSTNEIYVGWMRNKNENTLRHEVRYSFEDIHNIGWTNATPAPSGIVTPQGFQGYNGMEYQTDQISVAGHSKIFIAIKPENSQLIRQIELTW